MFDILRYENKIVLDTFSQVLVLIEVSLHLRSKKCQGLVVFWESSKKDPKRIGICPVAQISHFGIIKIQKVP